MRRMVKRGSGTGEKPTVLSLVDRQEHGLAAARSASLPVAADSERSFAALYKQCYPRAVAFARRYLSADDAEDVAQLAFTQIWQQHERGEVTLEVDARFDTLLYAILRQRIVDLRRYKRRLASRSLEYLKELEDTYREWMLPDAEHESNEFAQAVQDILDQMPPGAREAYILTRHHNLSYAQAAAAIGVKPAAVHQRMVRALNHLRSGLAKRKFSPALQPRVRADLEDA